MSHGGVNDTDTERKWREMDDLDDSDAANTKLNQLMQENAERRARLERLAAHRSEDPSTDLKTLLIQEHEHIPSIGEPNFEPDPRCFLREVVETHGELVQIRAILHQRLEHEKTMIQVYKRILEENRELNAILVAKRADLQKELSKPTPINSLMEESRWLNDELAYVATKLGDNETLRINGLWSLLTLLQEFMQRYLSNPSDPYLMVSVLPIHPNHIDLLQQCQVIQAHEDNPDLFCLTDYLDEIERAD